MRAYVELRQGNPYVFHREKRWTDPKFYTKEQKQIYTEVYESFDNIVCPQKYINLEKMTKNPAYFGEAYDICSRFGLLPLMGLHENYSDDLVAQFYSTVTFHGDNDDEILG